MFSDHLLARAAALLELCRSRGLHLATAESCTGGLLAGLLTETAGAGDVVDCGFVTYSNAAKMELLGVPEDLLAAQGAVSEATAVAMAAGALARSRADLAVAITGIAGPTGASPGKPIGLVHFALAVRTGGGTACESRFGDIGRQSVRIASMEQGLRLFERGVRSDSG